MVIIMVRFGGQRDINRLPYEGGVDAASAGGVVLWLARR
jgi:hypothetical protein